MHIEKKLVISFSIYILSILSISSIYNIKNYNNMNEDIFIDILQNI